VKWLQGASALAPGLSRVAARAAAADAARTEARPPVETGGSLVVVRYQELAGARPTRFEPATPGSTARGSRDHLP